MFVVIQTQVYNVRCSLRLAYFMKQSSNVSGRLLNLYTKQAMERHKSASVRNMFDVSKWEQCHQSYCMYVCQQSNDYPSYLVIKQIKLAELQAKSLHVLSSTCCVGDTKVLSSASVLDTKALSIQYTAEVVPLHMYIVWFTST